MLYMANIEYKITETDIISLYKEDTKKFLLKTIELMTKIDNRTSTTFKFMEDFVIKIATKVKINRYIQSKIKEITQYNIKLS